MALQGIKELWRFDMDAMPIRNLLVDMSPPPSLPRLREHHCSVRRVAADGGNSYRNGLNQDSRGYRQRRFQHQPNHLNFGRKSGGMHSFGDSSRHRRARCFEAPSSDGEWISRGLQNWAVG
jgi:hypothetical protein